MVAVLGAGVGAAQAATLPRGAGALRWGAAAPALWAFGWATTTLAGVDVEAQYTTFGLAGALAMTLAAWPLVHGLEVR